MDSTIKLIALLFFGALLRAAPVAASESLGGDVYPFRWGANCTHIVPADLDGDGLTDLLVARGRGFDVFFQASGAAFDFETPGARLEISLETLGWDVVRLRPGARAAVVALTGGGEAQVREIERGKRTFGKPRSLVAATPAALPRGFYHLPFARDVDGDGDTDLVVPGAGFFSIHLQDASGGFGEPLKIVSDHDVELDLDADDDVSGEIGQSVTVPLFSLRDVNGDGLVDWISETRERVEVFLARKGSFPTTPSYVVDLAAVRERLGDFSPDDLDFSNLTSVLNRTMQSVFRDVNGDGVEDLVLREGPRVSLFLGHKSGMHLEKRHRALRSSGNVFGIELEDENGDGLPDLWLIRVETISVGDLFLWLIASGSFEVTVLIYPNDGSGFASRPSRELTLTLRFPSALKIMKKGEELRKRFRKGPGVAAGNGDLRGRGARRDLVLVKDSVLNVHLGQATPEDDDGGDFAPLSWLLGRLGYSRERNEYVFDFDRIEELIDSRAENAARAVGDRKADLRLPLPAGTGLPGMSFLDFNGDGRQDLLMVFEDDRARLDGALVIWKDDTDQDR